MKHDSWMRSLVAFFLLSCMVIAAFGIYYVPRHDGDVTTFLLTVLLPTVGASWAIIRLLPRSEGS